MSTPKAGSRARARDERVAPGDERIGWGGCGPIGVRRLYGRVGCTITATYVLGGCGPIGVRVSQSRRIDHKPTNCVRERIGWGGCGQLVSGCRRVVSVTQSLPQTYGIGRRGRGRPTSDESVERRVRPNDVHTGLPGGDDTVEPVRTSRARLHVRIARMRRRLAARTRSRVDRVVGCPRQRIGIVGAERRVDEQLPAEHRR